MITGECAHACMLQGTSEEAAKIAKHTAKLYAMQCAIGKELLSRHVGAISTISTVQRIVMEHSVQCTCFENKDKFNSRVLCSITMLRWTSR